MGTKVAMINLLVLVVVVLLSGCASGPKLPRFVWPAPPDDPRLEYVGHYYSEQDFKKSQSQQVMGELLGEAPEATFKTPFGIVSDGKGVVYVSDIHDYNVRVYDFSKRTVRFLTKEPVFRTPTGMAIDSRGFLYVADAGLGRIFVFDADQLPISIIKKEERLKKPAYLALNEGMNRIYVSDGQQSKIVVFDMQGNYLFSFGEAGQGEQMLFSPQGIAFGPDGNLYVCDMLNARIQIFTAEGAYVGQFGERGDQAFQFENPKDLAFDSEGNLHIIDSRRSTLYTYTPDGKLLLVTGEGKATLGQFGFSVPKAIDIDVNDRIYVSESLGRRFTIWQYMSKAYLTKNPYTEGDKKQLLDYIEKIRVNAK